MRATFITLAAWLVATTAIVSDGHAQRSPLDLLREITRPLPDLLDVPQRTPRRAGAAMPRTLTVLPKPRPPIEEGQAPVGAPPTAPGATTDTIAAGEPAAPSPFHAFEDQGSADPALDDALQERLASGGATTLRYAPEPPGPPSPRLRGDHVAALNAAPPPPPSGAPLTPDLACASDMIALGVVADTVEPIRRGACGIDVPFKVKAFAGGAITLTQPATLTCKTATTVARWLRDHARPEARARFGRDVTALRVAASYVCRTRNNAPGARISEHAMGRAIDISAIRIDGIGWLEVGSEAGPRRAYLASVRRAACGPFKTVLGPGSDAHHADHFHLDLARRRSGGTHCPALPGR